MEGQMLPPGTKRTNKMLSLDELAQITAQQQTAGEVQTIDLTSKEKYVPNSGHNLDLKVDSMTMFKPGKESENATPEPVAPQIYRPSTAPLKVVQSSDLAPAAKQESKSLEEKWVNDLNNALDRDKQQMWDNVISPMYDRLAEEALYSGDDDELADPVELAMDTPVYGDQNKDDEEGDFMMETPKSNRIENVGDFDFDSADTVKEVEQAPTEEVTEDIVTEDETSGFIEEVIMPETVITEPGSITIKEEVMVVEPVKVPVHVAVEEEEIAVVPTSIDTSSLTDKADINGMDLNQMFPNLDDDNDEESESVVELTEEDEKEALKDIQMLIRKEAKPVNNTIDLATYKIASKATSASKVLTAMANRPTHTANWVLPNANRSFTMSALQGSDIEKLDPTAETGLNEIMRNKELYSVFYNYIIDSNKPESFEAWAKTIPFSDVPNLYFGAYRASFSHSANLLPYQCNHCKHSFMEKHTIESMVKFKDDDAKTEIRAMLAKDPTTSSMNITSKLFAISDDIAISFKTPSLYNIVFETASLPEKFRATYQNLVYYINCIENIFYIDNNNNKLIPVEAKIEATDVVKTISNRYKAYAAILQKLTPDQFSYIPVCLKEIDPDKSSLISFQIPETVCPKCGKKIDATPIDAVSLLFTRLRLQTILVI